ncbi:hypothetical protein CR205_03165 [Alteribacter lacisalsi]|uniref:VOC domain-containing protein n=1 Tax=Alteribacter lacisalsi TaxID=2045244 RepID=A0A2W0HL68_9BACI|nr:VOC family protein [Alteribacter lacisalsi]PYZ97609.1 hypothetical protein CR205_03165 [Alteribacter lacisalsi]
MTALFKRIDTVFLQVKNIDQSLAWYTETIGLSVRWHEKEGGYAALDTDGETPLTLVQSDHVYPSPHPVFNFYAENIEEARTRLNKNAVRTSPVMNYGTVRSFEFKDPDGNVLGVCHFEE